MIYDTLKLSRSLRDKAHFSQDQAEGLAEVLNDSALETLATKADITELRSELKIELSELRTELKEDIGKVRVEIADLKTELKGDIADLKSELKGDIAEVRIEMKGLEGRLEGKIERVRSDLLRFMVAQGFAIVGAVSVLVGGFIHFTR